MTVLVTGASGFIGRHVVAQLAAAGRVVIAASRSPLADPPPGVRSEAVDLLAPGAAAALIGRTRPTHLVHLAWNAAPGRFWTAPDNVDWAAASLALVAAFIATGGSRAVLAGTGAEYGWTKAVLGEDATIAPVTLYGAAKDGVRRVACAAGDTAGVGIAWGRVFWLYGPHEPPGRLVSGIAAALAAGLPAESGLGLEARDFLHVADVAGAFVAALDSHWRGPFNIGSGTAVPTRRVVELLGAAAGRPDLLRIGARAGDPAQPAVVTAGTRVLADEIGFRPARSLADGLAETYAWWRRHGNDR